MVMHVAREYGARALGVTLSRRQAECAQKAIAEAGLSQVAQVRHLDYRDVRETDFDAISSIGLTEHIGLAQLPHYFRSLYDRLRPGGRLLNDCITLRNSPSRCAGVAGIVALSWPAVGHRARPPGGADAARRGRTEVNRLGYRASSAIAQTPHGPPVRAG
jgi:cyclopropane fatty-acyl-phospholipid synthase-like methyltransferase